MSGRIQITIPKTICDECGFTSNAEAEVSIRDGFVLLQPKHDTKDLDARFKKS